MYPSVTLVRDGLPVRTDDVFDTSPWWVVYVRGAGDLLGAVYGGRPQTARRLIAQHAAWAGPAHAVVAYPFDTAAASAAARVTIEATHLEADRVENCHLVGEC